MLKLVTQQSSETHPQTVSSFRRLLTNNISSFFQSIIVQLFVLTNGSMQRGAFPQAHLSMWRPKISLLVPSTQGGVQGIRPFQLMCR